MQLGAIVFIVLEKALYMFRVLFAPIIRSVLKLYMQSLVQSCIGLKSGPVHWKMIGSRERTAFYHGQIWPVYSADLNLRFGSTRQQNKIH